MTFTATAEDHFPDCLEVLTIILDPFGKASLQTLVHGLQTSWDGLVSELPGLRSHQLLERRKHLDKASQAGAATRGSAVEPP